MKYFIFMLVFAFSMNAKEVEKLDKLKDLNYVTFGLSPILPAYQITQDPAWLLIPGASIIHRHFIDKRFAVDYEASCYINFNVQMAQVSSNYLFFPMPEYGVYLGAGYGMSECYYFCFEKHKFHYWSFYHCMLGINFEIEKGISSFVQVKYANDGCMSIVYGTAF